MKNIDIALNAFKLFRNELDGYLKVNNSESDTRSKLIDAILKDILGWDEKDITREGKLDSGYYDYKLSIPGFLFLAEAKKNYISFVLPTNHTSSSINAIYKNNKLIIDQIRKYSIDSGIQFGFITNGSQFLLLKLFNIDGTPWLQNSVLIFNGLDDIENRFVEFYNNFSKNGVIENGGFKFFNTYTKFEFKTILSKIVDRDKELIRNSLSAEISGKINSIFGEIFRDETSKDSEFIKKCFVENEETKKNRDEIERMFADNPPVLENVIPATNTGSIKKQIKAKISNDEISAQATAPPKPIIIVGSKGAGKTTFINHLFKVSMTEKELKDHLVIYTDLRKYFSTYSTFDINKICSEIIDTIYLTHDDLQLHNKTALKRIYHEQIKRKDDSTWSDSKLANPDQYNEKLNLFLEEAQKDTLNHLICLSKYLIKERRKRLIIILDNADQFNSETQKQVFLFVHSITSKALCGSVISLREGYYYKWRNSPPFDAYESNVFHISAPKYSEVLQRRIDYALENINLKGNLKGYNENNVAFEVSNNIIVKFLSSLKHTLFSTDNSSIIDFLNHSTYPNIREGLSIFKSFLTSGHTKVNEYVMLQVTDNELRNEQYRIPLHEFIKSIGLLNKHYYSSNISFITNIFIPPQESNDHFIKYYLLKELGDHIDKSGNTNKYIENSSVIQKFVSFGYKSSTINSVISELLKQNLIDTSETLSDIEWTNLPDKYFISITRKGYYYLNNLIGSFSYIDLILQDTPIYNMDSLNEIYSAFPTSDSSGKRSLKDRINVSNKFVDYLSKQEKMQPVSLLNTYGSLSSELKIKLQSIFSKIEIKTK